MPSIEDLKAAADLLNRGEVRKELTKEDDVKNVMKQITALESGSLQRALSINKDLPAGGDSASIADVAAASSPKAPSDAAAAMPPPAVPSPPAAPLPAPNWLHNIVQVISKEGRHFGRIFQLGDIKEGKAHGYVIKEHGALEHVTVPADHIATIGAPRIKSKYPCSDKWIGEHMGEK